MNYLFKGVATALTTPFTENGIDFEQFDKQIKRQLSAKIDALIVLGTTGESSTVTKQERRQIISFVKSRVKHNVPIIVGTGSNCTNTACELTKESKELGADGALVVTPYYNLCEQEGLLLHYKEIAKCKFPFIAYNVPKRTGVNILPKTAKAILAYDYAIGLKEASTDLTHVNELFCYLQNKFAIYCGSDHLTKLFLENNSLGTISVASNIIPFKIKEFISDFATNYEKHNIDLEHFFNPLFNLLSTKINPIPVKCLMQILYNERCMFRLPLTMPNDEYLTYLENTITNLNLNKETLC